MIASTPLSGFPISDFHSEELYLTVDSAGGGLVGGTTDGYGMDRVAEGDKGFVVGGAVVWTIGVVTPGGYPMYGDVCYGDMPYLLRQLASTGGAILGGDADYARRRVDASAGGLVLAGLADYFRLWNKEGEGGWLLGGWAPVDGDFSKYVKCLFGFKAPRVIFVMAADKSDIEELVRSYK